MVSVLVVPDVLPVPATELEVPNEPLVVPVALRSAPCSWLVVVSLATEELRSVLLEDGEVDAVELLELG